jgi:hypothetical protein
MTSEPQRSLEPYRCRQCIATGGYCALALFLFLYARRHGLTTTTTKLNRSSPSHQSSQHNHPKLNRSSPSHQSSQHNHPKLFTHPNSLFFYFKLFYDNMSEMTYTQQLVAVASGNSLCELLSLDTSTLAL